MNTTPKPQTVRGTSDHREPSGPGDHPGSYCAFRNLTTKDYQAGEQVKEDIQRIAAQTLRRRA